MLGLEADASCASKSRKCAVKATIRLYVGLSTTAVGGGINDGSREEKMAHQDGAATINRPNQSSTHSIHNRLTGRVRSNHNCSRAVGSRPNAAAATVTGIAVAVKPATTAGAADYSNCSV